jgi:starch-binding outer membrane protein, SusD/RagB family
MYSCEDSLTILPPDGKVKDEYWKSKEDVMATLMGAYKKMAENDELFFYYGELRADMLEAGANLSNDLRDIINSNIYPSNFWTNWGPFYSVINYCNLVLKYSPEVKNIDRTFSDYDFNMYNAEAIFLRSLAYFYLVRVFKDVPFVLTPFDTDKQDFFHAKMTDDVILDSLNNHLSSIIPLIPD